jgi:hypothetical protein
MWRFVDDVRTLWAERDPEYLHILKQIKQINYMLKSSSAKDSDSANNTAP